MSRIKYYNITTQEWEYADVLSGGGIPEAPIDGKQYARKNGAWSEVQSDGGTSGTQWNGKTAVFFGDSLTEINYHYTKGYHAWIKDILGLASYDNQGFSGRSLRNIYTAIDNYVGDADLIVVMGGVNDQGGSVPLGKMGDTIANITTYGSVDGICNILNSKFPNRRKLFITPHFQTKYLHSGGITTYEISKAIKEVCEKYSIAVYDNYVMSEIRTDNLATFTTDNCHWNNAGHELVGKNVAKWIIDKFRYVYTGVQPTPISVTGVTLNKNSTTIAEGDTETLTVTVAPANATNKAVTWATSSAAVATVNNGVVTAVSDGNATITVTTVDGGFTATCAVTVEAGTIVVTGISLNKATTTITEGATETLVATLQPSGASGTITWVSSDDTKATVENGVVTALTEGNATITASCNGFTDSCVVTVESVEPVEITITPIANTCTATYTNNNLKLTKATTQIFYGVDFNNCTKVSSNNWPSGNFWLAAKRNNGTYCGFRLFTANGGQLYSNIAADLSDFGAGSDLIPFGQFPVTSMQNNFAAEIVNGALVITVDGEDMNTTVTGTDFVSLAYTTAAVNAWNGLILE